jgi:hypothetical protein
LIQLLREEEIKWYQRSKTTNLLQRDINTKYFQLIANGKHRKTRIFRLEEEGRIIKGDKELKKYITDYYHGLFGPSETSLLTLDESRRDDISQVSQNENEILTTEFSYNEVKEAIFQMEHNKAPGPDGFPAEFYQAFWDVIKDDLLALFVDFHKCILLLPKKIDATQIQNFRPICLLNASFKIFTKVITNRLTGMVDKIVWPNQSAFMPGRYTLEGVVILHETLHELHKKKMNGVTLKLDFEKAYDKFN